MWKDGSIKVNNSIFHYWIKVFETGSEFGIDGGKVSKMMMKRDGEVVMNYDRSWDVRPVDKDTKLAMQIILQSEN